MLYNKLRTRSSYGRCDELFGSVISNWRVVMPIAHRVATCCDVTLDRRSTTVSVGFPSTVNRSCCRGSRGRRARSNLLTNALRQLAGKRSSGIKRKARLSSPSPLLAEQGEGINSSSSDTTNTKKMVTQITTADQFNEAIKSSKLVVVDFYATWCGPCKMIAPLVERFANEYTDAEFYKVDVDELGQVAQQQEVSAMPTILFFKNGQVIDKIVGANPNALKQKIAANI